MITIFVEFLKNISGIPPKYPIEIADIRKYLSYPSSLREHESSTPLVRRVGCRGSLECQFLVDDQTSGCKKDGRDHLYSYIYPFLDGFRMRIGTLCIILLFLFAALTTGCGVTASVSTAGSTQPVLLGKIRKLRGTDNEQLQLRVPFDISISNKYLSTEQMYAGSKATPELLKLTDTSDDRIVIDEVYIGSYSIFVIGEGVGGEEKSWADIKGGIYREQGHETK